MIISCGYKLDSHKGKINDIVKSTLSQLKNLNYISSDVNFDKIKLKDFIKCKLNFDFSLGFFTISENDRIKINSISKIDKAQLFTYYCYINARMHKRARSEGLAIINGGEYEYTYFSFNKVYKDLNITDKSIVKYNDILVDLNLIRYKNFGTYYIGGDKYKTTKLTPNFYSLYNGDEELANLNLKEGFKLYLQKDENKNKNFLKELLSDNRSIGGKLSSLRKKQNSGNITDKELQELKEIEELLC